MTTDLTALKLAHPLADLVERRLGPARHGKWCCPFHDDRTPSLTVFVGSDGAERYHCFGCGADGDAYDWLEATGQAADLRDAVRVLTGEKATLDLGPEARQRVEQIRRERLERQERERASALSRLERLELDGTVAGYHRQVGAILGYWQKEGIGPDQVERFRLGYCPALPLGGGEADETAVIPYYRGGRLVNLRHRLLHPNGHGKYRPEFPGLPNRLFNADALAPAEVHFGLLEPGEAVLVEGEKKTIVLDGLGFCTAGLPGLSSWQQGWARHFKGTGTVFLALDDQKPATLAQARRAGADLKAAGCEVRLAAVPCKPDDFFVRYGGTVDDFAAILRQGREL